GATLDGSATSGMPVVVCAMVCAVVVAMMCPPCSGGPLADRQLGGFPAARERMHRSGDLF
ncbi:hypothetical protein, partial [Streptomyces sp. NPDC018321]|uniref:hypothetical protein n=1 Tax=Streptomyces sp. NPDC018321 TaxID=3365043 RepID=UPI0037B0E735